MRFIMKKNFIFIALGLLIAFSSCQKSGLNLFCGNYSYKTTGSVTVQRKATPLDSITPAAFTFNLPNEIGQLDIATLDKHNDSVVVIINQLNGDVVLTHGYCNDKELTLKPFKRNVLNISVNSQIDFNTPVKIQGVGHCYDDNTLIFDMSYHGKAQVGPFTYLIDGDQIQMVAYRN